MEARSRFLTVFTAIGFCLILSRFFYWQIIKGKDLSQMVRSQYERRSIDTAYRGKILAKDGTIIVGQADSWNLFAEPKLLGDVSDMSNELAGFLSEDPLDKKLLNEDRKRIYDLLSDKERSWVSIKNRINTDTKDEIEKKNFPGIGFDRDEIRVYPEASSAAHLIGFLGKNDSNANQGYFGLEGFYDTTLSSSYGMQKRETDNRGLPLLFGRSKKIPIFSGADLVTYIDKGIQLMAEQELILGIEKYGATDGSVIVLDPKSGGVMAMSSFPNYDPQKYWKYSNELFLNPVISASFEPGSVFKVVTMASALDAGVVDPETECEFCFGPLSVGEFVIHTWNDKYYPNSTMTDVIIHSDNIGMAFVAKKMGIEKNYEYLKKFGIGEKTGIDLQGEMTPQLRSLRDWGEVDLVTSSFGQGIAVTPIQMITAVNVIANDGIFVRPRVVKNIVIDEKNYSAGISDEKKRVISEDAANKITAMMVEAAKNGESKWTYKKGFKVAGKTGTAQIPIAGHYDDEKTIASFVGFAPYNDPKFIMLVTLREPKSSPWASETAAPLWYGIAEKLFIHFGMIPEK